MRLTESALALCILICMAIEPAYSLSGDDDSNVLPPLSHTSFCIRYPDDCARTESTAALPASLDGRWRKMKLVNDSVNAAIAPKAKPDRFHAHWAIRPLEGDCNDFSVTKRHELLNAGWPSSSLLLAEVRLILTGEHHLILIVRGHRADWVLDNLKPEIVRLAATRDEYALVRIESSENPRYWTIFQEPSVLDHDNPRSNIAIMWLRSAKIAKASSYGYSRARSATMRIGSQGGRNQVIESLHELGAGERLRDEGGGREAVQLFKENSKMTLQRPSPPSSRGPTRRAHPKPISWRQPRLPRCLRWACLQPSGRST
jgi:predicted transglutaminase-like cysteine proteinase